MDKYNDYLLPDYNSYRMMREMYESTIYNRSTTLANLSNSINEFMSECYGLDRKINYRIRKSLEDIKKEIELLNSNLILNFSHNFDMKIKNIKKFNLFSTLKALNSILKELNWLEFNEVKTYYKSFAHNSTSQLLNCIEKLYSSLETSFVYLFKYL